MVVYDIYERLIFHQFGPNCDRGVALQPQVCSEVFSPFSNNCPNQKIKILHFLKKDPPSDNTHIVNFLYAHN